MKRAATPVLLALSLLTTVPVGRWLPLRIDPVDQGRSVACYPLVGVMIGLVLLTVGRLLGQAPAMVAAALLVAAWVVLTGALHLDGLADCADAWFAGHRDPQRTLAVMKDPAAGPVAVVALILVVLLKFAALAAVLQHGISPARALLAAPVLARAAASFLMAITAYRRPGGIARDQAAHVPRRPIAIGLVASLAVVAAAVPSPLWAVLIVVAALILWGWRRLWEQRIGGYTGDIVGALIELIETACLFAAAGWLTWA